MFLSGENQIIDVVIENITCANHEITQEWENPVVHGNDEQGIDSIENMVKNVD
jgi:hypothetical protein